MGEYLSPHLRPRAPFGLKCGDRVLLKRGESIGIPGLLLYRIQTGVTDRLTLAEVQRRGCSGEDDRERIKDDFGRVG
jgi:hypothetical protein